MHNTTASQQHYPQHEKALFEGSFSARLKELVVGSSRSDVLSAVRHAPLDSWQVSEDSKQVELKQGSVHLRFFANAKGDQHWITAHTPHGEFNLPRNHLISCQIARRLDRRFEGYALASRTEARNALSKLLSDVRNNQGHEWGPGRKNNEHWGSSVAAIKSYRCPVENGLSVEVMRELYAGEVSPEVAFNDYVRFEQEMRFASIRAYDSALSQTAPFGMPRETPFVHVRPPISPGAYRHEFITVSVINDRLTQVATALGLSEKNIISNSVRVDSGNRYAIVWEQASKSFK